MKYMIMNIVPGDGFGGRERPQNAPDRHTAWPAIVALYDGLVAFAPSLGARVGRAVAIAEGGDPQTAVEALDGMMASRHCGAGRGGPASDTR